MSGWDDFAAPSNDTTRARDPYIPIEKWPPLIREMYEDPSRPRATNGGERYAIHEFLMKRFYESMADEWARNPEWDDDQLRALGYEPRVVAPDGSDFRWKGYLTVVSHHLLNLLRLDYERPAEDVESEDATVIPDEGMLIGEFAEAIGASRRTAERRIGALVDSGEVEARDEPTERGGKPRKRYFRVASTGAEDA